ncbi:DEAD (Asp-Glu-Ala-Asp) box polypeptide 59 [Mortierella sp. NVP85]|nr:DEAD (Asp-Glu-Ala-Asp) box polypeptide 59 [Mortierella sp. NVP85]
MLVPRSVTNRKVVAKIAGLPTLAMAKTLLSQQKAQACPSKLDAPPPDIHYSEPSGTTTSLIRPDINLGGDSSQTHMGQQDEVQRLVDSTEPQCVVCGRYGDFKGGMECHNVCSLECQRLALESVQTSSGSTDTSSVPQFASTAAPAPQNSVAPTRRPHPYSSTRLVANITGYRESPRTAALSTQEATKLREAHRIYIHGKHIPKPILSFEDCSFPVRMLSNLVENGYAQPKGVQMQAIPAGLLGRDMVISAETGAGKTAGFLIPTIVHAYGLSQLPGDTMEGPYVLILTPTRELATQIEDVAKSFAKSMPNMRTALLAGGQAMTNQVHRLKQNIQVAVATPGRLVDILARHGEISFSNVFCLVLDEVDLMLSLGFRKQVMRILDVLPVPPNGRQTIVCSATISRQIDQIIGKVLQNPLRIRVGNPEEKKASAHRSGTKVSDVFSPSSQIKQTILWVENDSKKKQLFSLLKDPAYFRPPILVFVESRIGAELLSRAIQAKCPWIKAVAIHGEKSQEERSAVLKTITDGTVPVAVATGLLARGLDLKVATVINFDMAPSIPDYIHRVGRANPDAASKAAASIRKGPRLDGMAWAITFINNDHHSILGEFANMLHRLESKQVTPLPPQLKQLVVMDPPKQRTAADIPGPSDVQGNHGAKASTFQSSKRKSDSCQGQEKPGSSAKAGKKRRRN